MSKRSLSVALCTYNGAHHLREQLESIALQTRVPDEVVACDDGSRDATLEILRDFAEKAPFEVRVYSNSDNLGVARNFEKALGLCRGDSIALSDQDDVWLPRKLERLETALAEKPGTGFAFCDAEVVDEGLRPLGYSLWESVGFDGGLDAVEVFSLLLRRNFVTGACMVLRRDLLPAVLPVDGAWIHDYWAATVLGALDYGAAVVEDRLVYYRQHTDQQIGSQKGNRIERIRRGVARWGWVVERDRQRMLTLERRLRDLQAAGDKIRRVSEKRRYLEKRARIQERLRPGRLAPVAGLIFDGSYRRFAGHRSDPLKDLLARRPGRQKPGTAG